MDQTPHSLYYSFMYFAHRKFLILLLFFPYCLWSPAAISNAENPEQSLAEAEAKYRENKPMESLEIYQRLLAARDNSIANRAALTFDAGNAAFRAGKLGLSYAYFLRSAAMSPGDSDTAHNLSIVEQRLNRLSNRAELNSSDWTNHSLLVNTPSDMWLVVALLLLLACQLTLLRKIVFPGAIALSTTLTLLAAFGFAASVYAHSIKKAIVITEESIVRSGPGDTFPEIVTLSQGSAMEIRGAENTWLKVAFELPRSGNKRVVGWIGSGVLERLDQ